MKAQLKGMKIVDYISKKNNLPVFGIEIHFTRNCYSGEKFVEGSVYATHELLRLDPSNKEEAKRILEIPFDSFIDLTFIQNGSYQQLVDVNPYEG